MLLCLAAWAIPGAGHLWLGRRDQGPHLPGRAPADVRDRPGALTAGCFRSTSAGPLVGARGPRRPRHRRAVFRCERARHRRRRRAAVTYEYGNAYIIVAGLLNLLVVIDAYDIALGRK